MNEEKKSEAIPPEYDHDDAPPEVGTILNASGHKQELDRQFNLLSISAVGITTGNTWAALGGSIVTSLYNGGPPGVTYELIAVSVFYWMIAACISELASAIPSSAGVYHWASVTGGPKYGRVIGWYAGWWNFFAWLFGSASMSSILANQILAMWNLFHPDYVPQRWNTFVVYIIMSTACVSCVLFANRALPAINSMGLFFILAGVLISVIVLAAMPAGHASSDFVWRDWSNQTGWSSDGFVFLAGMLNGAYAVGTPDCVSHLAEEIPSPRTNIPKAIAMQMVVGLITAFVYLVALFYSVNDFEAVLTTGYTNPLAEIYLQATGSRGGSLGLLLVIFCPTICCCIGTYMTAGRTLWTLARDRATPFASTFGKISPTFENPFNATLACLGINIILGAIYVGSLTAFNAFVGSFVVLTTLSYLAFMLPHILSKRKHVVPGPFWMPSWIAYPIYSIASAYIITFVIIYCFPYAMPVSAASMNYSCLITGGLTIFVTIWWFWQSKHGYESPRAVVENSMSIVDVEVPRGSISEG